jgi:diaminopimelate epimerase
MNGAGNDFIVIDNRFYRFTVDELAHIARRFCTRKYGIGADGVLALEEASDGRSDARMRYLNADGSVGSMCGNGARCLARFARLAGIGADPLTLQTDAGIYRADMDGPDESVRLWMPDPHPSLQLRRVKIDSTGSDEEDVFPIWTGTEHAVCFVADLDHTDVEIRGRRVRRDRQFAPTGVNVDFVQIGHADPEQESAVIDVRTFEKGVEAETLACGTGAVAAAIVSASRYYRRASRIDVRMPGGTLSIGFSRDGDKISELYLEGPAVVVYRGSADYPTG